MSGGKSDAEEARVVLVVDDDDVFRERLVAAFARRGHETRGARDGETALALARAESPEWAVVDLRLDGVMDGLAIVRGLLAIDPTTTLVVLTGYGSIATAIEALRAGARDYLTKPADLERIVAALEGRGTVAPGVAAAAAVAPATPSLARVEWEHIQRVLADCDGNVSQAARLLGVHRRSLQRKLAKFPVKR